MLYSIISVGYEEPYGLTSDVQGLVEHVQLLLPFIKDIKSILPCRIVIQTFACNASQKQEVVRMELTRDTVLDKTLLDYIHERLEQLTKQARGEE